MNYVTVWETPQQNQLILVKSIFEQNNLNYRFLDEGANTNFPVGVRVQVEENQAEKARKILKENGFIGTIEPKPEAGVATSFWWYLFLALLVVIIVSAFINWYLF